MDPQHLAYDRMIQLVAIAVPIIALVIGGLLSWVAKQSMSLVLNKISSVQAELTEHKEDCEKISKEALSARLTVAEEEIKGLRKYSHWITEAVSLIAGKLNCSLPQKPF